jgi:hypothetical protein
VRVRGLEPQESALFAEIATEALGQRVTVTLDPDATLAFGGTAEHSFPPLWLFVPVDEAPARETKRFLWTGPRAPQGLIEQLNGLPCLTTTTEAEADWPAWAEYFTTGDFIMTDRLPLAALANALLKPALLLANHGADEASRTLPFTLGGPLPSVGRLLSGFDRNAAMADLLNWKRVTQARLRQTLRAQQGA